MNIVTRMLNVAGKLYVGLLLLFLYLPIMIMALMSFNASPFYMLPIEWSTVWYETFFANSQLIAATGNSVLIALVTTVISAILGTSASLALYRYDFPGKSVLQAALLPPIAIPWLITGTAMLIFFFGIGIGRGLHAIILGHVALALPYVIIVVNARLKTLAPELEEAARSLGASDVVLSSDGKAVERVMELTGGQGVDVAVEAVGIPATFDVCQSIRPRPPAR